MTVIGKLQWPPFLSGGCGRFGRYCLNRGRDIRIDNWYRRAGIVLLMAGLGLTPVAAFILEVTWLTAFGIASLILAFVLLALGGAIPRLSPEFSSVMLETANSNVAAIIEEFGITSPAIYLPSSLGGGRARALIPLKSGAVLPSSLKALPNRFIVRYGSGDDDVGLRVTTAGTAALEMLAEPSGATAGELETALTTLLHGILGVAAGVSYGEDGDGISVALSRLTAGAPLITAIPCLGSPLAQVVAAVVAEGRGQSLTVLEEGPGDGGYRLRLGAVR